MTITVSLPLVLLVVAVLFFVVPLVMTNIPRYNGLKGIAWLWEWGWMWPAGVVVLVWAGVEYFR